MTGCDPELQSLACLSVTPRGIIMDAIMHAVRVAYRAENHDYPGWDELFEAAVEALEQFATPATPDHVAAGVRAMLPDKGRGSKATPWQVKLEDELHQVLINLVEIRELVLLPSGVYTLGLEGMVLVNSVGAITRVPLP